MKRSNIDIIPVSERSKVIRQSCSCLMECDRADSDKDDERCHEKCTCHPDKDTTSVEQGKNSEHVLPKKGRKKFSHPHIGTKEMEKIKHLFTQWIKEYHGGSFNVKENEEKMSKSETLKEERVGFISKMLKNYQYFRQKEKTLRLLQQQQNELTNQQQRLEDLLTKQEDVLSRKGSTHDTVFTPSPVTSGLRRLHKDDVNITITTSNTTQAPPTTAAQNAIINQQTLNEIETIKKQIAEIRNQQDFLSKQQAELAVQLGKEEALFEEARQLIKLAINQNQAAGAAAGAVSPTPTDPQTQSDYESELTPEAPPSNMGAVRDSSLLGQLQRLLSRLAFKDDRNVQEGNSDDGEQMMFFQDSQEDQSNRLQNANSAYTKDADIPVEIDRSDLNDQGLRNSLFERNSIGNGDREDDNDNSFAMDSDDNGDDSLPAYSMLEKKTLHPRDVIASSQKTSKMLKKDKSDGHGNKTKNHVDDTHHQGSV